MFNDLGDGSEFTVTPSKNDAPTNGVSTSDLIHIKRHILGTIPLETPYQIIAADADKSGSLSARDLLHLRRLILVIDDEFRNNTSWRFIDKHHEFTDPANPFLDDFPETTLVKNMDQRIVDMDFVALKVGDVTGDATAGIGSKAVETRTSFTKIFSFADDHLRAGETVKLDFNLLPEDVLAGLQFTLTADPGAVAIRHLQPGALTGEEHLNGRFLQEGTLTFSWNTLSGDDWSDSPAASLFTLELEALRDVTLSDALRINSRYTKAVAQRSNGQSGNVSIGFTAPASTDYYLGQNYPNPFRQSTVIGFSLPAEEQVELCIFTLDGRVVQKRAGHFPAGYNAMEVSGEQLPAGVYFYRLEAGAFMETRKMLVR